MITMAERVRDVLARPEAYEGVFPVTEVPSDHYLTANRFGVFTEPQWGLSGAQLTPEAFDAVRERLRLYSTPLNPDSVAQRILDGEYNYYPRFNGEPADNAYGQALRGYRIPVWQARPTRFVQDVQEDFGSGRLMSFDIEGPPLQVRHNDHNPPRLEMTAYGDGHRPDHYRVRDGECACGFRSIFRGDMDGHIGEGSNVRG